MDGQRNHPQLGEGFSREPYAMRITDHGKIRTFVAFAIKFLQDNPHRPLVFHTLPHTKVRLTSGPRVDESTTDCQPASPAQEPEPHADEPPKKQRKLAATTATIPRLVSVVEIVKREYGKWAAARKARDGTALPDVLRSELHQYNELSCLEDLGILEAKEQELDEAEQLKLALEGKNFLKQKFTPHLKVTLSVHALPALEETGATHQPPMPARRSKAARTREKKRLKKLAEKYLAD